MRNSWQTQREHEQTCKNKLQQLDCSSSGDTQLSLTYFSLTLKNWECSHEQGVRFSYFLLPLPANHQSFTCFLECLDKNCLFLIPIFSQWEEWLCCPKGTESSVRNFEEPISAFGTLAGIRTIKPEEQLQNAMIWVHRESKFICT